MSERRHRAAAYELVLRLGPAGRAGRYGSK